MPVLASFFAAAHPTDWKTCVPDFPTRASPGSEKPGRPDYCAAGGAASADGWAAM